MDSIATHHRVLTRLPLQARRAALRVFWMMSRPAVDPGLEARIGLMLRIGKRPSQRIARDFQFNDRLSELEWLSTLLRTKQQLIEDVARIEVEEEAVLTRMAASGKPLILASLHMGNYVLGFARIMNSYFPGRPLLILRARDDLPAETRVMQRVSEIGTPMRFLKVQNKADYVEAVRFVRQGAVVIYFVDLPPSYGGPIDVTLFGQPLQLALGIDGLAKLADATVVPVAMTGGLTGDRVHVGRPFEVTGTGASERQRVAGLVCRHIETSILRDPAQWHFWPRLQEFAPGVSKSPEAAA